MSLWMSVPLQKPLILRSLQRSGHTFEGFNLFCILSISLVMDRSHNVLLQLCIQRAEDEAVASTMKATSIWQTSVILRFFLFAQLPSVNESA